MARVKVNVKSSKFFSVLCLLCLAVAWQGALFGQNTGTILGVVKDQSGAILPGATVTATAVDTGIARTTTTGARGNYRIPALAVGSYQVQAGMSGFQTSVRSGINLTVGRDAVVDFTLQVGNVAEQVTVTGEAPLVEATTATVSGVVDQQQMKDIPLNARSFIELVPLQTGAVFAEAGNTSSPTWGFGKKLSVVGTRYNANSFLLDGADINNVGNVAGSAAGTMAGVETVREFRVITNAYDAEYGRHTGAVISAVTKSGTNDFHGSIFEFLRNDNLDAPKWEDNKLLGGVKPEFRRNQFGGSLGGPIIHDKTFFFGSYEGLRQQLGKTNTFDVPGVSARQGLFGGENIGLSAATAPYIKAYPMPNVLCSSKCIGSEYPYDSTDGSARFSKATNQVTNEDFFTVRVDHRFSDSDSIFARVNTDDASVTEPSLNVNTDQSNASRFATLEETHIYSPQLIGRTHFSFNRTVLGVVDLKLKDFTYPIFSFDGGDVPGRITVTNLSNWGGGSTTPKAYVQNLFQFKEDLFYTTGIHSFKFGGQLERYQFNDHSGFHDGGTFTYGGVDDFMLNGVQTSDGFIPGPATANFVKPGSDNFRGSRQILTGLYIQDDINVRPGLTLNLGLRYEFITVPIEVNGKVGNIWDITDQHIAEVTPATVDVGNPYFENPSLKNFAPRIGFAWDPFQTGKTSIRGGIGEFHQQILPGVYRSPLGRSEPFYAVAELQQSSFKQYGGIDFPNAYTSQHDLLSQFGGRPQFDGFQHYISQTAVYKWSLNVQQEVAPDTTVEAGYSGTRGTHLIRANILLNTKPREFRDGRAFILLRQKQPNQAFNRMRWRIADGTSDYHALRLSATKRFSHNFQFQSSYTFSKSIDESSTWVGSGDFGSSDRNGFRREKERGLSGFDVRQSFDTNFVIDLPGTSLSGAAGTILGGWTLSSIMRFNSGFPFYLNQDFPRDGSNRTRYVSGPSLNLAPGADQGEVNPQNPDQYYNPDNYLPLETADFGTSSAGFFMGTIGKNHIIGPGVANFDLTLMKDTPVPVLGESGSLEFRAEFFNLFNRPNFSLPNTRVYDRKGKPQAKRAEIESTAKNSREIQFALKLVF